VVDEITGSRAFSGYGKGGKLKGPLGDAGAGVGSPAAYAVAPVMAPARVVMPAEAMSKVRRVIRVGSRIGLGSGNELRSVMMLTPGYRMTTH
jgi:hypothetical protein